MTTNTKVKTDIDTKITVRGNVFVDRRPLLSQGFKPSEIVDDWGTVFNPFGILNSSDSTIIVDLNHNSSSTGAEFLKYESVFDDVQINNTTYSLPVLKAEVLFREGNTGKIGAKEVDVFDMVKNAKSTGWSATAKIKSFRFYDENWRDVTQEVKDFVKSEVWSVAPNLVKRISKEMNKDVYCSIDSYYLVTLSVLTDVPQGHFDAGFKKIEAQRGVDISEEIIAYRYINNIMEEDTKINQNTAGNPINEGAGDTTATTDPLIAMEELVKSFESIANDLAMKMEDSIKHLDEVTSSLAGAIEKLKGSEEDKVVEEIESLADETTREEDKVVEEIESLTDKTVREENQSEIGDFDPKSENQASALVDAERGVQKTTSVGKTTSVNNMGITPYQRSILTQSLYTQYN